MGCLRREIVNQVNCGSCINAHFTALTVFINNKENVFLFHLLILLFYFEQEESTLLLIGPPQNSNNIYLLSSYLNQSRRFILILFLIIFHHIYPHKFLEFSLCCLFPLLLPWFSLSFSLTCTMTVSFQMGFLPKIISLQFISHITIRVTLLKCKSDIVLHFENPSTILHSPQKKKKSKIP